MSKELKQEYSFTLEPSKEQLELFLKKYKHSKEHILQYRDFVKEAFSCEYHFASLIHKQDKNIQLMLPIVPVNSKIFGRRVFSTAYIEFGGFCGDHTLIPELLGELKKRFKDNYDFLEIRSKDALDPKHTKQALTKINRYKRFELPLPNEETVWKGIQKSKRKAIKKSLKGLEVREIPQEDLGPLYKLYLKNMRAFGTPPYGKRYFTTLYKQLIPKERAKIFGAYHKNKLIGALVGFTTKETKCVHIVIAIYDHKVQDLRPNDATHWTFIKWAIDNDYETFDFGLVREESGQFTFKKRWGAELKELPTYYALWKASAPPNLDPSNSKFNLAIKIWRRLPLKLTQIPGMWLRRGLGI